MQKKLESNLLPVDYELERTIRSLRKVSRAEKATMLDERIDHIVEQETTTERPPIQDTMEDFLRPVIQAEYSTVKQPAVEANNFELKPTFITMVWHNKFTGHPTEDPNEHLGRFLRMANIVKLNSVRPKVIKLHLFPFSLRDIVATWYESLPYGSIDIWEKLVEAFLGRFFPHPSQMKEEGKS